MGVFLCVVLKHPSLVKCYNSNSEKCTILNPTYNIHTTFDQFTQLHLRNGEIGGRPLHKNQDHVF